MLKPFVSFYGGKYKLAQCYPGPAHDVIIEPFAGFAGYSTYYARPGQRVILCDIDPVICGVWDYLIRASPAEILRLPATVDRVADLPVCEEARNLIGFWCSKAQTAPGSRASPWQASPRPGRLYDSWGSGIIKRLAAQVVAIRNWRIINESYENIGGAGRPATWFIDPPYNGPAGRAYRYNVVDYAALATWCKGRSGRVIVCEQAGANWLPFKPLSVMQNTRKETRTEVFWTNIENTG